MTPGSIGIAFLIAAVTAVAVGFAFRRRRWRSDVTFASASIVGLVFMRASKPGDLLQSFRPSVALDWLPWFIVAAVAIAVATKPLSKWRWLSAAGLAVAVAARSLWQSIYARDLTGSPLSENVITLVCIAAWIAMLIGVMTVSGESLPKRFSTNVIAWALSVACTAIAIAMTGSLTYGAAVGTIAVSILATLLVTGSLPMIASVPIVVLVGLSVAFSELHAGIAMLLGTCFVGLVATSRWQHLRWPSVILAAIATTIIIVGQLKTEAPANSGYGQPAPTQTQSQTSQPEPQRQTPPKTSPGEMPDPFGGIGLP